MASYRDWTGVSEEASTLFTLLDGRWLERYSGPPFGLKKSQTGIALLLSFSFLFNTEAKPKNKSPMRCDTNAQSFWEDGLSLDVEGQASRLTPLLGMSLA